jgi:uncharacterized protein
MIPLIDEKRDELVALCRQYHVRQLELFGSAATGEFVLGKSDLDFLVQFDRNTNLSVLNQYFGFRQRLSELFCCKVDLVEPGAMRNPYFIRRVNESRTLLYAA